MSPSASVLHAFGLSETSPLKAIHQGLMHGTWFVHAEPVSLVLQRLHPKLATAQILNDYRAVTAHLAAKGFAAPRLIPTRTGQWTAEVGGHLWRLTTRLPGRSHDRVSSPQQAQQGAQALGRFHRAMADLPHEFESQHPLHDTQAHLESLRRAADRPEYAQHREGIAEEIDFLLETLPTLLLPADLPRHVVHGDPKISNILFEGERATALIDLDTCNRHSVLVDLGDAVRSWCRDGAEDERQYFHFDRFDAILRGYAAEGLPLSAQELRWLPHAGRLITLELAARFARDALESEYFAYDAQRYPDRRSHNRARTRAMIYLAERMAAAHDRLEGAVARHFH